MSELLRHVCIQNWYSTNHLGEQSKPFADSTYEEGTYRCAIGILLYLTTTRPDINFTLQFLSQFVQSPNIHHHQVINQVLRYIKGSPARGLFFPSESNMKLNAFIDSDWCHVTLHEDQLLGFVYTWNQRWYHGKQKNRVMFQDLLRKWSTDLWHQLHASYNGSWSFFKSCR